MRMYPEASYAYRSSPILLRTCLDGVFGEFRSLNVAGILLLGAALKRPTAKTRRPRLATRLQTPSC